MYHLIYQQETDGEIFIESIRTKHLVYEFIKEKNLHHYDLVDGVVLKSFNQKSFNLEILKGKHY